MAQASLRIKIKILNLDKITARFKRSPGIIGKHISKAINESVQRVIGKTKPITPVKTGRLVGSFGTDSIFSTRTRLTGAVRSLLPYASKVHNLHPAGQAYRNRPIAKNKRAVAGFLKVGVDQAQPEVNRVFAENYQRAIKELGD